MGNFTIDEIILKNFEEELNPRKPEESKIGASILGFGEISTTFSIDAPHHEKFAFKRMPIFKTENEVSEYKIVFEEYHNLLDSIALMIPPYDYSLIKTDDNRLVFFDIQKRLDSASIGSSIIHTVTDEEILIMVSKVFKELKKVWDFNKSNNMNMQIGIDGQISNWSAIGFNPDNPKISKDTEFYYIDTSTPFITKNDVEQLDAELVLRAAPSFLLWIIRWLFLEDVMTRYYDFHLVVVDLIANFFKEQRSDLIPRLIQLANDFFKKEGKDHYTKDITEKEIKKYYKEDALIWRVWLFFRKIDRFIMTRIFRRYYPFILPVKIKR